MRPEAARTGQGPSRKIAAARAAHDDGDQGRESLPGVVSPRSIRATQRASFRGAQEKLYTMRKVRMDGQDVPCVPPARSRRNDREQPRSWPRIPRFSRTSCPSSIQSRESILRRALQGAWPDIRDPETSAEIPSRVLGYTVSVSADGIKWTRKEEIIPHRPEWRHAFDSPNVAFWSEAEQLYVCYFRTWTEPRSSAEHFSRSTSRLTLLHPERTRWR